VKGKIFVGMGKGIEVELARLRLRLKLDPRLSPLKFCLIVRSLGSHPQMTSLAARAKEASRTIESSLQVFTAS